MRRAGLLHNFGLRNVRRRFLVLQQQAVHHFLILVGNFGVAAVFVVAGTAREKRAVLDGCQAECGREPRCLLPADSGGYRRHGLQLFGSENETAVGAIGFVPFDFRGDPVVHADIEIGQHENRRLELFGEIETPDREFKTFGRIRREQQNVFGIAVRSVRAFEHVTLLGAGRHTGGRTDALDVDDDRGNLGVISQAKQFIHQRDAGTGGGSERTRSVPGSADHHADCREFVFGLDEGEVVLAGFRVFAELVAVHLEGIHH